MLDPISDVDRRVPAPRRGLAGAPLGVLAVISLGGAIGALARYGLNVTFPHSPAGFAWATFSANVSGCFLIGVLMASIDQFGAHRLIRPFLGVGVLGGYTTFSTYIVEIQQALDAGAARLALVYLAGTLAACLAAVWMGWALLLAVVGRSAQR
jgi:fluoride exporter